MSKSDFSTLRVCGAGAGGRGPTEAGKVELLFTYDEELAASRPGLAAQAKVIHPT